MTSVTFLLRILAGHLLADFALQPRRGVINRQKRGWRSWWLYAHGLVYSGLVFASSGCWNQAYWLLPSLFVSHILIDRWKSSGNENLVRFIIDQTAHLLVLLGAWLLIGAEAFSWLKTMISWLAHANDFLLISIGYLLILWPSGYVIGKLTDSFRQQIGDKDRGLENAGLWIGCLERLFIFTFILLGIEQAIAILAGAKSIFRFGEIKDPEKRKETEYILIGSLLSYGFALAIGFAVKRLSISL